MKIRPGVELASLTDVGCRRENNEDSYIYWEPEDDALFERIGRLAVIADGMGGHEGGQIASQIAVQSVKQIYAAGDESQPQQRLLLALEAAHQQIRERARNNPALEGMGTTCTAFSLVRNQLCFAHAGDSRLYLLAAGELRVLTHDHTLVAHWVENGVIRPEDAANHPQKHVLTTALGVAGELQPDSPPSSLPVEKGNTLMLCTDGLWGLMESAEIQRALTEESPEGSCRSLVQLAKERGGPDNITLLIMRVA